MRLLDGSTCLLVQMMLSFPFLLAFGFFPDALLLCSLTFLTKVRKTFSEHSVVLRSDLCDLNALILYVIGFSTSTPRGHSVIVLTLQEER